jgi:hypothetical protein
MEEHLTETGIDPGTHGFRGHCINLSQEIRQKGHSPSVPLDGFPRFDADTDPSFSASTFDPSVPFILVINECSRILKRWIFEFSGETAFILDTGCWSPGNFFDEEMPGNCLKTRTVNEPDRVVTGVRMWFRSFHIPSNW